VTLAQENKWTNLVGGIPIRVEGLVLCAVAAGSGTGAKDLEVARAGAAAIKSAICSLISNRWAPRTPAQLPTAWIRRLGVIE
jgi:hypothetical protein